MANKVYYAPESAVVFKESGGTVSFTPRNISSGTARMSAQYDRGTGSKPGLYRWYALTKAANVLTVGTQLSIYLAQSYGSGAGEITGNIGTSDAALATTDKLRNLGNPIGILNADSTTNGEVQVATGFCFIYSRYISVVWYNLLGQALTNTADDHTFILEPMPPEIQ